MSSKPKVRRFAHGTKVPVSKTKLEIDALLQKHGASATVAMWDREKGGRLIFRLADRMVRFDVAPIVRPKWPAKSWATQTEAEERRRWRALLLRLKAHLEVISAGEATVEQELLGHVLLPDGRTVAEAAAPELAEAYASGKLNNPLLLGSGRG